MFLKVLIFFVTLTAHVWLWGHWNFSKSTQLTLLLIFDSCLALYILGYPLYYLTENNRIKEVFRKKIYIGSVYLYVLLTLILSLTSFYGLLQYILPIKILLIVLFAYFKWQGKKVFGKKNSLKEKSTRTQTDNG